MNHPTLEVPRLVQTAARQHPKCFKSQAAALRTLVLLLLVAGLLPPGAGAADTFFNNAAVLRDEVTRVGGEGMLMVKAPVDTYLPETVAVAGAFALSYLYDQDIRKDLAANHSRTLTRATDAGSIVGDPYLQIGVAALLYGTGALGDHPRVMQVGEELGEALVLSDLTTVVLKQAVGRGRPGVSEENSSFKPFQFKTDYDSLPSMHTASSFAMASVLASETDSVPVKILCYAGASFVGFSRLYKEKHWSSDVVLAAAIGELAGDSVTRYRATPPGKLTIAPTMNNGVPSLALLGKF